MVIFLKKVAIALAIICTLTSCGTGEVGVTKATMPTEGTSQLQLAAQLAFVTDRRLKGDLDIGLFNLRDNSITLVTADEWQDVYPTWSPNGRNLAFVSFKPGGGNVLRMADIDKGSVRIVISPDKGSRISRFSWSPDGLSIFYTLYTGNSFETWLWRYDLASGSQNALVPAGSLVSASPNGRYVGLTVTRADLNNYFVFRVLDIKDGRIIPVDETEDLIEPFSPNGIAWSPLANAVAVTYSATASQPGQLAILTVEEDGLYILTKSLASTEGRFSYCDPVWSATGESIVVIQAPLESNTCQGVPVLYSSNLTKSTVLPLGDNAGYIRWSSDSKLLVYTQNDNLHVLQFAGGLLRNPRSDIQVVNASDFSLVKAISNSSYNGQPSWRP